MSDAFGDYSRYILDPTVVFCPHSDCQAFFSTYERLEVHIADEHSLHRGSVQTVEGDEELGDDEEAHHDDEEGDVDWEHWNFKCLKCEEKKNEESKKFMKLTGLKHHYKSVHHIIIVGACTRCFNIYLTAAEHKAHAC